MILNDIEQQQLVYCWLQEANMNGDHPVVYAGHQFNNDGFDIRFFLLKKLNGFSQYRTINVPIDQVERDVIRFRIGLD